jgi:hypothetical protein
LINPETQNENNRPGELWQALNGPMAFCCDGIYRQLWRHNFQAIFGYTPCRSSISTTRGGGYLMVVGLVSAVIQGTLTGPLTNALGNSNNQDLFSHQRLGFWFYCWRIHIHGLAYHRGIYPVAYPVTPAVQSLTSRKAAWGRA